jgi:hypothetical protein
LGARPSASDDFAEINGNFAGAASQESTYIPTGGKGVLMNKHILALVAIISIGGTAHAGQWTKVLNCSSGAGTFVADRDSDSPEGVQFVITGREAVNIIANGIQGNASVLPQNLHIYDGGNKLVISDLTMTANYNPAVSDPYVLQVVEGANSTAILKYWSGSEINPQANYVFYNCSR